VQRFIKRTRRRRKKSAYDVGVREDDLTCPDADEKWEGIRTDAPAMVQTNHGTDREDQGRARADGPDKCNTAPPTGSWVIGPTMARGSVYLPTSRPFQHNHLFHGPTLARGSSDPSSST
jgi:hypothetical protein